MRLASLLLATSFFLNTLSADQELSATTPAKTAAMRFEPFTGKITGSHVRMRMQPSLDGPIYKELDQGELVLITGQVDDFYACMPPKGLKGYVFRTYVLDGVIEGNNVFVRLGPDRSSPSVTLLNSGDTVKGTIAAQNNKWLQIDLPEDVRFFVAKDFIKQVGDAAFFSQYETRKQEALKALNDIEHELNRELERPFAKIQLAPINTRLTKLINDNKDMSQVVTQAESLISRMQESYLAKSVSQSVQQSEETATSPKVIALETKTQEAPKQDKPVAPATSKLPIAKAPTTTSWKEREEAIVNAAIQRGKASTEDAFYEQEMKGANTLHGIVKPYTSFISSKPGDFVLMNLKTNLPIAYLYSTKVDLSPYVNKPVTIWASSRPNNNFAFPAYYVLQVEE